MKIRMNSRLRRFCNVLAGMAAFFGIIYLIIAAVGGAASLLLTGSLWPWTDDVMTPYNVAVGMGALAAAPALLFAVLESVMVDEIDEESGLIPRRLMFFK